MIPSRLLSVSHVCIDPVGSHAPHHMVTTEGDLDHCVGVHMIVYTVVQLCVSVGEKDRVFDVWDAYGKASHSVP